MTPASPPHPGPGYEAIPEAAIEVPLESPVRRLRRALRGRYRLLVPLALALATIGGAVGYRARTPVYESSGLVLIEGILSPILYESQETRAPPMFEAHVAAQVAFIQSRRVLEAALDQPAMREAGWPAGLAGLAELQRSLSVRRARREHVLTVIVTHADPLRSQIAVDAVLEAFRDLAPAPPGLSISAKATTLTEREEELVGRLAGLRAEILERSDQYDYPGIVRRHATRVEEMMLVDRKLEEIQSIRARVDRVAAGIEPFATASSLLAIPTDALQRLEDRERALVAEIESHRGTYGSKHPTVRELGRQLAVVSIEKALLEGNINDLPPGMSTESIRPSALDGGDPQRLDRIEQQYTGLRARIREDVERLGDQRVGLAALNERAETFEHQLAETRRRLDQLRLESRRQNRNRVSISAWGDFPVTPASDRRRSFAIAGALFGGGTVVAVFLLVGLVDPRLRYADELSRLVEVPPLIGLIPPLAQGSALQRAHAERIVHRIRSQLELQRDDASQIVHAVTSAGRGEGRTSLVLALGRSFAAAGSRTLLVDADGGGGGLSREIGLTNQAGLRDAAVSASEADVIHPAGQDALWVMPIGTRDGSAGPALSRARLERVIQEVRSRFDVVLIDTGPLLTGIEASLATAVADDAVLVVERYRKIDCVRAALEQLARAGARCRGVVLNRAARSDLGRGEREGHPWTNGVAPLVPAPDIAAGTTADAIPLDPRCRPDAEPRERRKAA